MKSPDILIIGSGPGGYSAAVRAAKQGFNTTIVEKKNLGGVCLNWGCIPTKIYCDTASFINNLAEAPYKGIDLNYNHFDIKKLQKYKDEVVYQLTGGIEELLLAHKVEIIKDQARFISDEEVDVGGETYKPKNIIIATGSETAALPIIDNNLDLKDIVYETDKIFNLVELPEQIAIVGGGVIGAEFAYIFNSLGVKVNLIEVLPNLLPLEDNDISQDLKARYEQKGINVYVDTEITDIYLDDNKKANLVTDKQDQSIKCDLILKATGRKPSIDSLSLENTNVNYDKNGISVDDKFQSSVSSIYAIGDVIKNSPQLAHFAYYHGEKVIDIISGNNMVAAKMDLIPRAIFSSPEIGAVGMTESQASQQGENYTTSIYPMYANGRAVSKGDTNGFIKMITEAETNEILGIHIVGHYASELINEASLAMQLECTAEEIIETIHVHPTIGEGYREAAMNIFGKSVHFG